MKQNKSLKKDARRAKTFTQWKSKQDAAKAAAKAVALALQQDKNNAR